MAKETYYDILEVDRRATSQEVRSAFLHLAQACHPDLNNLNEEADARFKQIREAYEVLGDPKRRAVYDNRLFEFTEKILDSETPKRSGDSSFSPIWPKDLRLSRELIFFTASGVIAIVTLIVLYSLPKNTHTESNSIHRLQKTVSVDPDNLEPDSAATTTEPSKTHSKNKSEQSGPENNAVARAVENLQNRKLAHPQAEPQTHRFDSTVEYQFDSMESQQMSLPLFPSVTSQEHPNATDENNAIRIDDFGNDDIGSRIPTYAPNASNYLSEPKEAQASHLKSDLDYRRKTWETAPRHYLPRKIDNHRPSTFTSGTPLTNPRSSASTPLPNIGFGSISPVQPYSPIGPSPIRPIPMTNQPNLGAAPLGRSYPSIFSRLPRPAHPPSLSTSNHSYRNTPNAYGPTRLSEPAIPANGSYRRSRASSSNSGIGHSTPLLPSMISN